MAATTKETQVSAAPGSEAEEVHEGFDNGLAWREVKYRGTTYRLEEMQLGDYDELETKATATKVDPLTGAESKEFNQKLHERMMLGKVLAQPRNTKIASLGTRVGLTLVREMNALHFTPEVDELRKAEAKNGTGEEEAAGNR
jgi:hypothetical protein